MEEWGILVDFATGIFTGNGDVSTVLFDDLLAGSPRYCQTEAAAQR
ncbi:MAG: hypothetical protein H7315_13570 [Herminiimonas sp.]|nr:hypothetical protein [Herminiimonas sp.]